MNAIATPVISGAGSSSIDVTDVAKEAVRLLNFGNHRSGPMSAAESLAETRDMALADALEEVVLNGEPIAASDCIAQLVLLVNRIRQIAENPQEEVATRVDYVLPKLQRITLALADLLAVDALSLGATQEFDRAILRAIGVGEA